MSKLTHEQTDRWADRVTYRQLYWQADGQTNIHTDVLTDSRHTDGLANTKTYRQVGRQANGQTDK
jgi:hypothetical protein